MYFLYHNIIKNIPRNKTYKFSWLKHGSFKDTIYNALVYHDIYLLLELSKNIPTNIRFKEKMWNKLHFYIGNHEFVYNRLSLKKEKTIKCNHKIFTFKDGDPLSKMLHLVLNQKVNFNKNNILALKTQKLLDLLNAKIRIAVIGAGIFGITTALKLQHDFNVTLIERNSHILQEASSINQFRLHKGYHYPRSKETAMSSHQGLKSFIKEYPCEIKSKQYYAIAKTKTKVTSIQYENFLNKIELPYKKIPIPNFILKNTIEAFYLVPETLFDSNILKQICKKKLKKANINLILNKSFQLEEKDKYDIVINCTYSNYNMIIEDKLSIQYEICEKLVIKMPDEYKGIGVVIMDGPFFCFDPYSNTDFHVMGNVVHAIHHTNNGLFPIIPSILKPLLNKGIIYNPSITKFKDFIVSASKFIKNTDKIKHIGSMFTIRAVLPNRDHDDARPSIINMHSTKCYSLFSGKIVTCVDKANDLIHNLKTT